MASMWRRAMVYLGLQDDPEGYEYDYDGYEAYDDDEPVAHAPVHSRRVEPVGDTAVAVDPRVSDSPPTVRAVPREPARERDDRSGSGSIRAIPTTPSRVHVVEPEGFNDAQEVGDRLKANQPVILNLQGLGRDLQRRLIDFSSGLAYAVGGSMQRVADQVFLLTPSNVEVSQEEKERLQARGLYRT
jgi:cell division inhibitor SepF